MCEPWNGCRCDQETGCRASRALARSVQWRRGEGATRRDDPPGHRRPRLGRQQTGAVSKGGARQALGHLPAPSCRPCLPGIAAMIGAMARRRISGMERPKPKLRASCPATAGEGHATPRVRGNDVIPPRVRGKDVIPHACGGRASMGSSRPPPKPDRNLGSGTGRPKRRREKNYKLMNLIYFVWPRACCCGCRCIDAPSKPTRSAHPVRRSRSHRPDRTPGTSGLDCFFESFVQSDGDRVAPS